MKILLLSRYGEKGASSRVRYLQYLSYIEAQGASVEVVPLLENDYLTALYAGRRCWRAVVAGFWRRMVALVRSRRYELVILEKEVFPWVPAFAERALCRMGVPYVADYDDALFHRYDSHGRVVVRKLLGRKIDVVMRHAAVVVVGNEYLANRARTAGAARVEVIPTVVDTDRYRARHRAGTGAPVVGWIGTPKTSRYLQQLLPVFEAMQRETPIHVVAVGARGQDFAGTPVEVWPWSAETEVASIQQFDIGIMPLDDSPWERGKCGYKLLQYMACGLPVVASPVGVNREIVSHGSSGLLAGSVDEWRQALGQLVHESADRRQAMGVMGRERVERWYSLRAQAPRLWDALRQGAH